MSQRKLPKWLLQRIKAVTGKRPKTVLQHILKHRHVTSEDLKEKYGYQHPPRAARDVREEGIPLETFRVKDSQGRSIGVYRFVLSEEGSADRIGGRKVFSKEFKKELIELLGCRCTISREQYDERHLQIDHRVPYEVAGDLDPKERKLNDYMLLCGSCNRAKSWSCEHCVNWKEDKRPEVCKTCYWAAPESYKHVALRQLRRLDIVWTDEEVAVYDRLRERAEASQTSMPEYVKAILRRHLGFVP